MFLNKFLTAFCFFLYNASLFAIIIQLKHSTSSYSKNTKSKYFQTPHFPCSYNYLNTYIWFCFFWGRLQRLLERYFCAYKRLVLSHITSWHMWLTPCGADSNDGFGPLLYARSQNPLRETWTSPPQEPSWSRGEIQAIKDGLSRKAQSMEWGVGKEVFYSREIQFVLTTSVT